MNRTTEQSTCIQTTREIAERLRDDYEVSTALDRAFARLFPEVVR